MRETPGLIAGGGPTGLGTTILLRRHGIRCRLVVGTVDPEKPLAGSGVADG